MQYDTILGLFVFLQFLLESSDLSLSQFLLLNKLCSEKMEALEDGFNTTVFKLKIFVMDAGVTYFLYCNSPW